MNSDDMTGASESHTPYAESSNQSDKNDNAHQHNNISIVLIELIKEIISLF